MIANSEKKTKNRNNKELGYINYDRTKSVDTWPIFSSKNITSFSQNSTGQVKVELHTTIGNGFYIIRFYRAACNADAV